jgi:hypothetical protein
MDRLGHASPSAAIRYQHRVAAADERIAEYLDEVALSLPNSRTFERNDGC